MKKLLAVLALALLPVISACGGLEPQGSTEQEQRICPLYVPLCEAPCKLTGPCNNQCRCPGDVIQCGTSLCNARTQVCCLGAINTYSCVNGDVCTF